MTIIRCSEKCLHQEDGYCKLNTISNVVGNPEDPCVYYQEKTIEKKEKL